MENSRSRDTSRQAKERPSSLGDIMTFKTTARRLERLHRCEAIDLESGAGYHIHPTYDETFIIATAITTSPDGKLPKLGDVPYSSERNTSRVQPGA
jgi:hypothetical protein